MDKEGVRRHTRDSDIYLQVRIIYHCWVWLWSSLRMERASSGRRWQDESAGSPAPNIRMELPSDDVAEVVLEAASRKVRCIFFDYTSIAMVF